MAEVSAMWMIFSIFLVLLLLGIEYYVPPVVSLFFFIGVIVSAAYALMPAPRSDPHSRP